MGGTNNRPERHTNMKITVNIGGRTHTAHQPYDGAPSVEVNGWTCERLFLAAACGSQYVAGIKGTDEVGHDTHTAKAGCARCGATVGTIKVAFNTLFGIEEDARVLNSRCRVY
jgi:hypothetical protein